MICLWQMRPASWSHIVSTPLCFQYQSEFYFVQFKICWLWHVHARLQQKTLPKLISVMWPSASKHSAHITFKIFLVKYVDILILSFGLPVFNSSTEHTFHVCRCSFLPCMADEQDKILDKATEIGHQATQPSSAKVANKKGTMTD